MSSKLLVFLVLVAVFHNANSALEVLQKLGQELKKFKCNVHKFGSNFVQHNHIRNDPCEVQDKGQEPDTQVNNDPYQVINNNKNVDSEEKDELGGNKWPFNGHSYGPRDSTNQQYSSGHANNKEVAGNGIVTDAGNTRYDSSTSAKPYQELDNYHAVTEVSNNNIDKIESSSENYASSIHIDVSTTTKRTYATVPKDGGKHLADAACSNGSIKTSEGCAEPL